MHAERYIPATHPLHTRYPPLPLLPPLPPLRPIKSDDWQATAILATGILPIMPGPPSLVAEQTLGQAAEWPKKVIAHARTLAAESPGLPLLGRPGLKLRTSSTFSGIGTNEWIDHTLMRNGLGIELQSASVCVAGVGAHRHLCDSCHRQPQRVTS